MSPLKNRGAANGKASENGSDVGARSNIETQSEIGPRVGQEENEALRNDVGAPRCFRTWLQRLDRPKPRNCFVVRRSKDASAEDPKIVCVCWP